MQGFYVKSHQKGRKNRATMFALATPSVLILLPSAVAAGLLRADGPGQANRTYRAT